MQHAFYRVTSFKVEGPYVLRVGFDDATEQVIDFRPVLAGDLFGPLLDLSVFNEVQIDSEIKTLFWPNGADFDPQTLHDWPIHADKLASRARQWSVMPTRA